MISELIGGLRPRVEEGLEGVRTTEDGLVAAADARYGDLVLQVEHDLDAASIRVLTRIPMPGGTGPDFLLFCLSLNTQYWDVKIGLDDDGMMVVHADLDAEEGDDLDALAELVVDRAETIVEMLDGDVCEWLLERKLGTPAQIERWSTRQPSENGADES
jgi:hypothetical protein